LQLRLLLLLSSQHLLSQHLLSQHLLSQHLLLNLKMHT
jgi:hypothetical protein